MLGRYDGLKLTERLKQQIVVDNRGGANGIIGSEMAANYASTGVFGFNHFGGELFKRATGIEMIHTLYNGGGPATSDVDVIAGNIPVMFTSVLQVLPHVRSGLIRMLAVGAEKRSPVLADVGGSGYPGYEVAVWWGFAVPAGVPRSTQEKLSTQINAIMNEPDTKQRLLADAAEPLTMTPAEMRKMVQAELRKWRKTAKAANIGAE